MKLPMIALLAVTLPALTLAACASKEGGPQATGPREPISLRDDGDACGSSLVQSFVGLRANATVRAAVAERSEARTLRWVGPNDAVTLDFSEARLTGELDADGVIVTLRCG